MDHCEFCRVVDGRSDAHRVYEDADTLAFLDTDPAVRGHTLVVPKVHHESLLVADEPTTDAVFRAAHVVAQSLRETLAPDGFSLFHTSAGIVGTVTHAHVHLVPRYADDGVHVALPRDPLSEDEGARLAAQLRSAL